MATTTDYLTHLQEDKKNLANILVAKGVNANDNETFTSLVSKVIEIEDTGEANPILQNKTVSPAEKGTEVTCDENYDGLGKVTVNPIKANMIEGLTPNVIKKGIEILDIEGTYGSTSQSKIVFPSEKEQIIKPDKDIEFLSQVTVQPVTASIDSDIISINIRRGVNILGVEGSFDGGLNFQNKTVSANAEEDLVVTPSDGFDAMDSVTVKKVTASVDSDIRPENIRKDVNILGVKGTYAPEPAMQNKYITASTNQKEVYPDEGYGYFEKVTIAPVTSSIDSDIKSYNIKKGVKILDIEGILEELNGEEISINPSTQTQTIVPNSNTGKNAITKATVNPVTSAIDKNIANINIKKGVTILGVEGSFEGATVLQDKTVKPTDEEQKIKADYGYDALSSVTVESVDIEDITVEPDMDTKIYNRSEGKFINSVKVKQVTSDIDPNIQPENIKQNMSILGVVGTYKGEGDKTYFSTLNKSGTTTAGGILYAITDVPSDVVITTGYYTFSLCHSLVKVPELDYSGISNAEGMFYKCTGIKEITNAVGFTNVTNVKEMFTNCTSIVRADLRGFSFNKLTAGNRMFYSCTGLTEVDISGLTNNDGKLQNLAYMFSGCSKLSSIIANGTKLYVTTHVGYMFQNCSSLVNLDLSWLYTTYNLMTESMFQGCSKLQKIDIRNMMLYKINTMSYSNMFKSVPTTCEIIVGTDADKTWMATNFASWTNVKTVAEYEAEQGA